MLKFSKRRKKIPVWLLKKQESSWKSKSTFKNHYEPAPTTDLLPHQERKKESERERETHTHTHTFSFQFFSFFGYNFLGNHTERESKKERGSGEMTVGLVGSEETRWGRWRWWWSSLTRKQAKKQPIALETDLSRNPTTDLHTNPNSNSRFHNQHTIDFLIITHYYYLPMSCLLSSAPFLFYIFLFFFSFRLIYFLIFITQVIKSEWESKKF